MRKLILFIILLSGFTLSKEYRITKVFDNNIFEIENGQLVQLADVYVPSINESNNSIRELAMQIYNWANYTLVGHDFIMKYITTDSIPKIKMYRSHLGTDEDITQKYILYGYAIFTGDPKSEQFLDYMDNQNTAKKNKKGIWSLEPGIISAMLNVKTIPNSSNTNNQKDISTVKLLNGDSIHGIFLSATDSTATYETSIGIVTIKKNLIISVQKDPGMTDYNIEDSKNKILIKEYKALPLLAFTIAGGIWAYTLFKDASDYNEAANILSNFGTIFKAQVDEANSKSESRLWLGIGVSVVSIVFLVLAVTPSESYVERPVSVIPTSNGIQLVIRF